METPFISIPDRSNRIGYRMLIIFLILSGFTSKISAVPDEWLPQIDEPNLSSWNFYFDFPTSGEVRDEFTDLAVALSCKPEVNVSLGQDGYAIITALMLVNAPEYPANMYEVDIMGPLHDTAFCAQVGQELMVVVTDPTNNSCMSTIFIEDKLKPVMNCIPDTLPCNVDINEIDFESTFEPPDDNCDQDLDTWYSFVIQNLACNPNGFTQQILVTWTATDDSGNSATCVDIIYLQKPSLGEIVFPPDISVSCVNANTDPSVTGEPTFEGNPIPGTCQIMVWKTDVLIPMCNGAYKILRTWNVMDGCTGSMISDVQVILVVDNNPPDFTCPPNITVNASPGVCTTNYTLPLPVVTDACADPDEIDIIIFVSTVPGIFSPGQVVSLGLGVTLITIRATDPCGNSRQCQYSVTVRDNTPPLIICPGNVTVDCNASTDPSSTGTATAFDNCDATPTITYSDVTVASSSCALGYNITRTWKATDDSGNMAICMQMIVLTDNTPPFIQCPSNIIVTCTESTAPANTGTATATDFCDTSPSVTFSDVTAGGSCPQERTINRTWSATDDCGNTSTCLQVISVEDNLAPVITCPPDITIMCVSSSDPGNTGSATASDNCDAIVTVTFADVTVASGPQQFTINRTWTGTDDCGNSSTCLQAIVVHDETPPVITCPVNLTISCTATTLPPATGLATATDNCDLTPGITYSDVVVGGICPQESIITRTWVANDDCGNSATCTQTIVVDDSSAPTITCPSNIIIHCTAMPDPAFTGMATATDNCDLSPTITFSDVTVGGSCPQERTITRTWVATDDCGNSNSCTQTILVDDSVAPTITCPANVMILCTDSTAPGFTGMATATDNCDITPAITFSDVTVAGSCPQERTITRTWTATDDCGNSSTCTQTITVNDNQAPAITCPINITIECTASTLPPATGTATATDNCAGTPTITFSDVTVGGSCPQERTITRTWTASDGCGNNSTCTQTITVNDGVAPLITCPSDITIECLEGTNPSNTGMATATDNCDGTPNITFSDVTVAGGGCPSGSNIIRTWIATDDCGNSSTCTQSIVFDDATAPLITCPANVILQCEDDTSPNNTGLATATDVCDPTPTITFSDVTAGAGCPDGFTITRTWTATDDCGNSSTCNQIIEVTDTNAPAVFCPADVVIECSESTDPVNTGTGTATDNCDDDVSVTFSDVTVGTACPQVYAITRTWIATDNCGNTGTCNQTIELEDTTDPVCQTIDITVSLGGSGFVTITASQVNNGSSDNCGPVELSVAPNMFDCEDLGDQIVTLTVTDCSDNSSTCTATVTVEDTEGLQALCQNVIILIDANGNAHVSPEEVDNGSGGGCSGDSLGFELSQEDFNCSEQGDNIVVLTVTDLNTNSTATCTAVITVIDNIDPVIDCPDNLTVDCHEVTDPDNTGQFGNATATDNCPGVFITETHVLNLNDCNVGTIVRTFTATDQPGGNTATCTQTITIVNPNPMDESDIDWPDTPININICNSTDPEDIPNGVPVIDPSALLCADPEITFEDDVDINVDNNPNTPCQIITRTWTVLDDCQPNGTFVFVQTINVTDMVPPVFTNINDMTKVANAMCVANFTLIASATDCGGVTITNDSPYGLNDGANASGNYPIGVTVVIFTATDGCGNISTMDVVITVTDPDPTEFQCEKVVFFLPIETEITLPADTFVTFFEGNCTTEEDFIVSYSGTNPFDTLETYDCGDVGVTTFSLWFWNSDGTEIVDSCQTADLDLRDPLDFCMDGLLLSGDIKSEDGHALGGVEVSITNAPMIPDTTDNKGQYIIEGLNDGTGYNVAPFNDEKHKEGVSTLDLVLIQKHLLGKAKLSSPYKIIAADANKSGRITAIDLLEIRKLILGIYHRFPNNTSWRFIEREFSFIDPYNPFDPSFPESVWIDSVTQGIDTVNFIAVKIGDVNGSYFLGRVSSEVVIEPRTGSTYEMKLQRPNVPIDNKAKWELVALPDQGYIDGMQFSLYVGQIDQNLLKDIGSDIVTNDQWYYDAETGMIVVSWSTGSSEDLTGKVILSFPDMGRSSDEISLVSFNLTPEAYTIDPEETRIHKVVIHNEGSNETVQNEYHLYQNIPNPFNDETVIRFSLPKEEEVRLVIHDLTGRQVQVRESVGHAGINEMTIKNEDLGIPGIYYYTLSTLNASFTRKMSYTNN